MRELNSWQEASYTEYLDSIKNFEQLTKKLKDYILRIIKYKKREITSMSEPAVRYDDQGKNRYIEWS